MEKNDIPIGEALAFGWRTTIDHIGNWILVVLVAALLGWIPLVGALIGAGLIRITLNVYDEQGFSVGDLFSETARWIRFFLATILYTLIVIGGLILCVIPGIYWGIKYFFFAYYIVDRDYGIMESIRASGDLTEGIKLEFLVFWIVLGLINAAGAICLGVGLFLTIPLTLMATVFVYRGLEGDVSRVEIERTSHVVEGPRPQQQPPAGPPAT